MPASERAKEEEGGEPKNTTAQASPHLGDLYRSLEPEIGARLQPEAGPASLFAESLSYELNRSLRGAAQLAGAEGSIAEQMEPQQASDRLGRNAQMLGRAAGGLLPMLGIAFGTRYGFGKLLAHGAEAVENLLLKRTSVGLSAAESGATGVLYGSLLTPTDGAAKDDFGSFAFDRGKSGASSGLAFALMSVSSIGLSKLASSEIGVAIGAERLMKIGAVNGIVSGIPGGIANVEADSLVRTGKPDLDGERLGRSMYQMSLFGGTFGLGASMLARVRTAGNGVDVSNASTWKDLTEGAPSEEALVGRASADESPGALPAEIEGKAVSQDWSRESLIKAISEGRDIVNADLRGLDLRGIDFAGVNLESSDFTGSNLAGVDFSKAFQLMRYAKFDGADLAGADFSRLVLEAASFKGAKNLAQVNFDGADLSQAAFGGSDLKNVDFRNVKELSNVNFEGADLDRANFSNKKLTRAWFENATLTNAIFENAELRFAGFRGSNLTGANFRNTRILSGVHFDGADLSNVDFSGAYLTEAKFTRAKNFSQVTFEGAALSLADFAFCDLTGADFSKVKSLQFANFTGANLDRANFAGVNLLSVMFEGAKNLERVNFSGASLNGAVFRNTDARGVDFSKVVSLYRAKFDYANLAGADFSGRSLKEATFNFARNVTAAKFNGADIRSASFIDTDLTISHYLPMDRGILHELAQIPNEFDTLTGLAKFVSVNPVVHKSVLERELLKATSASSLTEERLLGLAGLQKHYGEDSPVMRALTEIETDNTFLFQLAAFIEGDPVSRAKFVADKVLAGASAEELSSTRLTALIKLTNYFSAIPGDLQGLLEHEANGTVILSHVADFIQENPEAHKRIVLQELEKSVGQDAIAGQFDYGRLKALSCLSEWFGKHSDLMQPILRLEREGLSLSEVAGLLNEDPVKQAHVQTLIATGASLEQVQKAMRESADSVAHYFGLADGEYLERLADDRLRTRQLRAFIADNPTARVELVEELIHNNATVKRFHDQMNLSMLPDDISSRLLENSNVPVSQIIGLMRNWQSGPYFRELLIEQVRAGDTISRSVIEALSVKAQEIARVKNIDAQASKVLPNRNETEAEESKALFNQSSAVSQRGLGDLDQSGSGGAAKETTFPITNPRAIEAANIIGEAIEQIVKEIPEQKTIVVLGRDALPLYPALREHGRKVQYFLWSRLQEHDGATGEQWLREVGPGAVVIDTGYAGSIPDAIRKVDPTASAYLLSSASHYPQLLKRHDHSAIVNNLEYFPKLVARSRTYTENGGAVSRQGDWDEHDAGKLFQNRWTVESLNRQFLRAIGLDEWGVWRYSRYAGLTPEERLGLNTREEVEQHYARVRASRAEHPGLPGL